MCGTVLVNAVVISCLGALLACGYNPNFVGAQCAPTKPQCPSPLVCLANKCAQPGTAGGSDGADAPIVETEPPTTEAGVSNDEAGDGMPDVLADVAADVPAQVCAAS